jgi:hypothetical protein
VGTAPTRSAGVGRAEGEVAREPGRVWVSTLYTGDSYAPELPWQSGVRLEASGRLRRWLYVGAGYVLHPATSVSNQLAGVRILDHGPSVWAGVVRTEARYALGLELVVGLTNTRRETSWVAGQLADTPDSRRSSALIALRVRGRVRMPSWPRVWLEVAPALELVNTGDSAVMVTADQTRVLSPRDLRFRLDAGFSFDVL